MAWSFLSAYGTANNKVSGTTLEVFSPAGLTIPVGAVIIVSIAVDNNAGSDGATSLVSSVVGDFSGTFSKALEYTNTEAGSANDGVTLSVWYKRVTASIAPTDDTITITLGTAKTAKVASAAIWQSDQPYVYLAAASGSVNDTDPASMSIAGLPSRPYLFYRAVATERESYGFGASTNYTALGADTTSGSTAATNVSVGAEYRIATATGDTTDPTTGTPQSASVYLALGDGPLAPVKATETIGTLNPTTGGNIALPSGTTAGDMLVLMASTTGDKTIGVPGTWTLINNSQNGTTSSGLRFGVWAKMAGASEPAVAVTLSSSGEIAYTLSRITGVHPDTPIAANTALNGSGSAVTYTGVTADGPNTLLLAGMALQIGTASGTVAPTGFTKYVDQGAGVTAQAVAWKANAPAGATGNLTGSITGQSAGIPWISQLIAIRGPGFVPSTGPKYTLVANTGSFTITPGSIADLPGATTTRSYTENTAQIANPARGFTEAISPSWGQQNATFFSNARTNNHHTLFAYLWYFNDYRGTASTYVPIAQSYLDLITAQLDIMRTAGAKCYVRASYDQDGSGSDVKLQWILNHIDQLAPIFTNYSDVIVRVDAGFVGSWGEWAYSQNFGNTNSSAVDQGLTAQQWADRKAVVDKLLAVVPTNRQIGLRMPNFKRYMYGTTGLTDANGYGTGDMARLAFFNDAFLSSSTDMGTYISGQMATEQTYLANETKYVSIGGESAAYNPPRSDGTTAQQELQAQHYSYLNDTYHPDTIQAWKNQGVYETIKKRLGYRLRLVEATLPNRITSGGTIAISFTINNDGYAAPFVDRPVKLVLRNTSTNAVSSVTLATNIRKWQPGPITVSETVTLPALAAGSYEMLLHLPDEAPALASNPLHAIQLANTGTWDSATGYNSLNHTATTVAPKAILYGTSAAFTVTPQSAALKISRKLVATAGAFALTGQNTGLKAARRLVAAVGSFTLTGYGSFVANGRRLIANTGSFILSEKTANLRRTFTLVGAAATFSMSGYAANLSKSTSTRTLTATTAIFTFTPYNAVITAPGRAIAEAQNARLSTGSGGPDGPRRARSQSARYLDTMDVYREWEQMRAKRAARNREEEPEQEKEPEPEQAAPVVTPPAKPQPLPPRTIGSLGEVAPLIARKPTAEELAKAKAEKEAQLLARIMKKAGV